MGRGENVESDFSVHVVDDDGVWFLNQRGLQMQLHFVDLQILRVELLLSLQSLLFFLPFNFIKLPLSLDLLGSWLGTSI